MSDNIVNFIIIHSCRLFSLIILILVQQGPLIEYVGVGVGRFVGATYQILFLLLCSGLVIKLAHLNNFTIHIQLRFGTSQHNLLNALLSDEMKNVDILLLPYTMCSILGLKIRMGIPDIDKINCSMETVGHVTYQSLSYLQWAS